jgi:hypothetical protein
MSSFLSKLRLEILDEGGLVLEGVEQLLARLLLLPAQHRPFIFLSFSECSARAFLLFVVYTIIVACHSWS